MNTIAAKDIKPETHVWVGDRLVYVGSVRTTFTGAVSINEGSLLLAANKLVTEA